MRASCRALPQEQIDARDEHEVKLQTARHHRINDFYNMLRKSRGFRGRRGARDASVDTTVLCARLWAGLVAARLRLGRRLGCCLKYWAHQRLIGRYLGACLPDAGSHTVVVVDTVAPIRHASLHSRLASRVGLIIYCLI